MAEHPRPPATSRAVPYGRRGTQRFKGLHSDRPFLLYIHAALNGVINNIDTIVIIQFNSKTALTRETAQTYISALTSLYLFDKIPAWAKSDYEKIGKRGKYIATDTSLIATTLGWSEDAALFDDKINGKLAEAWAYHEISAQTDIGGHYEISHYRDSDKREVDFIIEDDVGRTAGIEVKCGSVVGQSDFKHLKWFQARFKKEHFVGIVLYTGSDVLGFGNNMYAVPFANLVY